MYKGEVLIPEDQLGSFCQTAVSLKIKGLNIFFNYQNKKK